jgi:hypothetical protein
MDLRAWQICPADNLASIVDPESLAVVPSERAQIRKHTVLPEKRMDFRVTRKTGCADYLFSVIQAPSRARHGAPGGKELFTQMFSERAP